MNLIDKIADRIIGTSDRATFILFIILAALVIGSLFIPTLCHGEDDFTIVLIPDTQLEIYYYPGIVDTMTQWLANNWVDSNIVFIGHVGDIVQNADSLNEWVLADSFFQTLDTTSVRYAVTEGNHDLSGTYFDDYFGLDRFNGKDYWGGYYDGLGTRPPNRSTYYFAQAGSNDFIIFMLNYDFGSVYYPDQIAWVDSLMKLYSDRRAIIFRHELLEPDDTYTSALAGAIVDSLKDNPNFDFFFCGHRYATNDGAAYKAVLADDGDSIRCIMANYQYYDSYYGSGWMRLLKFSPAVDSVYMTTYSPWLDSTLTTYPDTKTFYYNMSNLGPYTPPDVTKKYRAGDVGDSLLTTIIKWDNGATLFGRDNNLYFYTPEVGDTVEIDRGIHAAETILGAPSYTASGDSLWFDSGFGITISVTGPSTDYDISVTVEADTTELASKAALNKLVPAGSDGDFQIKNGNYFTDLGNYSSSSENIYITDTAPGAATTQSTVIGKGALSSSAGASATTFDQIDALGYNAGQGTGTLTSVFQYNGYLGNYSGRGFGQYATGNITQNGNFFLYSGDYMARYASLVYRNLNLGPYSGSNYANLTTGQVVGNTNTGALSGYYFSKFATSGNISANTLTGYQTGSYGNNANTAVCSYLTATGALAANYVELGSYCTYTGASSGAYTNGQYNVGSGYATFYHDTTNYSIALGYKAAYSLGDIDDYKLYIGSNPTVKGYIITGDMDNDSLTVNATVTVRDSLHVKGNTILDDITFGEGYIDSDSTIAINVANKYYAVLCEEGDVLNMTKTDDSTFTINKTGWYDIRYHMTADHSAVNSIIHASFFVDDVEDTQIEGETFTDATGNTFPLNAGGIAYLESGEEWKVKTKVDKTGTLTISHFNATVSLKR